MTPKATASKDIKTEVLKFLGRFLIAESYSALASMGEGLLGLGADFTGWPMGGTPSMLAVTALGLPLEMTAE